MSGNKGKSNTGTSATNTSLYFDALPELDTKPILFGGGTVFGQRATPADVTPSPVVTKTSTSANSTIDSPGQTSPGVPPKPTRLFGIPMPTEQPSTELMLGGSTTNASVSTTGQPTIVPFWASAQQQAGGPGTGIFGGITAFGQPKPASGSGNASDRRDPTLDPGKLMCIEELLRKSLLGEELVNTQFHLFSAKSSSGRVTKPRVLCANNALLAKSSKYFLDLLSSDISPSDPSLTDLTDDTDVSSEAGVDDYGYDSDSDLDDADDPGPIENPKVLKNQSAATTSSSKVKIKIEFEDSDQSSNGSDTSESNSEHEDEDGSVKTTVQATEVKMNSRNHTAMRLRSLGSRHILVKDTAFQTWYTLLDYLYTGKFSFLPLRSTTPGEKRRSNTNFLYKPRCSAKSMYRLASKVGLDSLRNEAFAYIRSNLTEHNVLKELSCSVVSKYPQLLEMELDVLYCHIASPPIVANFATLAQRIAGKELPHGADIVIGIYKRVLKERLPFSSKPTFTFQPLESVKSGTNTSSGSKAKVKKGTRSPRVEGKGVQPRP